MKNTRIVLLLVLLVLIVFLSLPLSVSRNLKSSLVQSATPLLKLTDVLTTKICVLQDWLSGLHRATIENKDLRRELSRFIEKDNQLEDAVAENQRLKKLLDLKISLPYKTVACKVIGRDASTWYNTLIINQGKKSGLDIGMPVLSVAGVVGRIVSCRESSASVLLVTDINSSIGGIVRDTRTAGLVVGQGNYQCVFDLIPKKADLSPGAVVITSGLGDVFPKGLLIGRITSLDEGLQDLYQLAALELAADIDRIEEVLVIDRVP